MKIIICRSYFCKLLFLFFGLNLILQVASAHEGELNLELNKIKSIQVSSTISAPLEVDISPDDIELPFKKQISKKSIEIDQNNHEYDISTNIEVIKTLINNKAIYSVIVSFHYSEPCHTDRTNIKLQCNPWESFGILETFKTTGEVKKYLITAVNSAAEQFSNEFK